MFTVFMWLGSREVEDEQPGRVLQAQSSHVMREPSSGNADDGDGRHDPAGCSRCACESSGSGNNLDREERHGKAGEKKEGR